MLSALRLRLSIVVLGLFLAVALAPAASAKDLEPQRPALASLVIHLDNGYTYALTEQELKDKKGGAIFWGDWAVFNLLVPYHFFNRQKCGPDDVVRIWNTPSHGQLPGFIIKTQDGPVDPFADHAPAFDKSLLGFFKRPRVLSIVVGLEDGRSYSLTDFQLYDEKSGVLLWNDEAVKNMLMPFYFYASGLKTSAADVLDIWNRATPSSSAKTLSTTTVPVPPTLPPFIVKPACTPWTPSL